MVLAAALLLVAMSRELVQFSPGLIPATWSSPTSVKHLTDTVNLGAFLVDQTQMVSVAASPVARTYSSLECAFEFTLPNGWEEYVPEQYTAPRPCDVYLRSMDWTRRVQGLDRDLSDYTIHIRVFDASFEEAARQGGFIRKDDTWLTVGRQGITFPAMSISGHEWRGLTGSRVYGRGDSSGYAGLGETLLTVLHRGTKSAIIESDGWFRDEIYSIVNSFKFLTCKRKSELYDCDDFCHDQA